MSLLVEYSDTLNSHEGKTICYACGQQPGEPRDIDGTTYYICTRCYRVHTRMNSLAVRSLKRQVHADA